MGINVFNLNDDHFSDNWESTIVFVCQVKKSNLSVDNDIIKLQKEMVKYPILLRKL